MRYARQVLLATIVLIASAAAWAQGAPELAPVPFPIVLDTDGIGTDFQVGVASDGQGNFVVIWTRFTGVGQQTDLLGRLFDAQGQPRGPIFQINSDGHGDRQLTAVAMNRHGHFVVIWDIIGALGPALLRAQLFGPGGFRLGGEIQVDTTATSVGGQAAVGMDDGGNFVIAWPTESAGILVRQFNRQGQPLAPPTAVASAGPTPFFLLLPFSPAAISPSRGSVRTPPPSCRPRSSPSVSLVRGSLPARGSRSIATPTYSSNLPASRAAVFPAGYQLNVPAVVASPTGFIVLFDNYDCGTPVCSSRPSGIYGWMLDFRDQGR
jgi:hypothetical protein